MFLIVWRSLFPSYLIFEKDGRLQMVEIKSGQTVTSDYIRSAQKSVKFAPKEACEPWLIHGGEDNYERNGVRVMGWKCLRHKILD